MNRKAPLYPYPIAAYGIILFTCLMHIYKAEVILETACADNNIPLHALLYVAPDRIVLAGWMLLSAVIAFWDIWREDLPAWLTASLIVPQGLLLLVTASGAYWAFWTGHYINFDPGCASFIGTDQIQRAAFPFLYAAAVYQRVREAAYNWQVKRVA